MFYNSDKANFHSFILGSPFSLYNEWSLVYFRQITTSSAEVIYQKRLFLDASKFVFVIMLLSVKDASKSKHFASHSASNFSAQSQWKTAWKFIEKKPLIQVSF